MLGDPNSIENSEYMNESSVQQQVIDEGNSNQRGSEERNSVTDGVTPNSSSNEHDLIFERGFGSAYGFIVKEVML